MFREESLKMANSENVDLMGLGKHCSIKSCNRLDFLPFKCFKCGETFCLDHRNERDHNCPNTELGDSRVPVCPICNQMITKSGKEQSINDRVERHILSGCRELVMEAASRKSKVNRCTYKNCRHRELIPFVCPHCEKVLCLRHRHALDHECVGAAVSMSRAVTVH